MYWASLKLNFHGFHGLLPERKQTDVEATQIVHLRGR
jgi:hypothetical protein